MSNEKPFGLTMPFGDALRRLVRVPKAAVQTKVPEKPKAARARVKRKSG
jgi:hypothetical protein